MLCSTRQGEETPHPLTGQKPQSAATHQCPLAPYCAPVLGALPALGLPADAIRQQLQAGHPQPSGYTAQSTSAPPCIQNLHRESCFFGVFFFFSRVFLPVSQNEMYLISVLGLLPLQRLCAHSRKACFIPCVLTMRQTITLCYTGNLRCFTFFSSFWHYSVHFIGI